MAGRRTEGRTIIGNGCVIGRDTIIEDSTIGDRTDIRNRLLKRVKSETILRSDRVYLRPKSRVGNGRKVGDFVGDKNAVFGDGLKASHLCICRRCGRGPGCQCGLRRGFR